MDVTTWLRRAEKAIRVDFQKMQHLKGLISANHRYYSCNLGPTQIQMMAEDLMDYPVDEIEGAMRKWRVDGPPPGQKPRPPLPCDLIGLMRPPMDRDAKANAMASTILACIGKFGYMRPDRAQDYMGEASWQVVTMRGSWVELCRSVTVDNLSTFHAQLRDTAKAVLAMRMNPNEAQPQLGTATRRQLAYARPELRRLSSIGEVIEEVRAFVPEDGA